MHSILLFVSLLLCLPVFAGDDESRTMNVPLPAGKSNHQFDFIYPLPQNEKVLTLVVTNNTGSVRLVRNFREANIHVKGNYRGKKATNILIVQRNNQLEIELQEPAQFQSSHVLARKDKDTLTRDDLQELAEEGEDNFEIAPSGEIVVSGFVKFGPGVDVKFGQNVRIGREPDAKGELVVEIPPALAWASIQIKQISDTCHKPFSF